MRMNEKDYRKFVKEVNKSLIVLKKVIMQTKDIINRRLETNSVCDGKYCDLGAYGLIWFF